MNRLDFCALMAHAKQESGKTTSDISFSMKMLLPTLRRFEKGEHNFNLKKVMEYLSVLCMRMVLVSDTRSCQCVSYDEIVAWMKNARQGIVSQRQLAEQIGCAYLTIANIERGATAVSVDTFLKIIDALGYTIKIEKI